LGGGEVTGGQKNQLENGGERVPSKLRPFQGGKKKADPLPTRRKKVSRMEKVARYLHQTRKVHAFLLVRMKGKKLKLKEY